jgi:hypothetical protein
LADDQNNWFKLKNWDHFKESKKYYTTLLTMKEYSARYEKEYLNYLKKAELNQVREINKDITELSNNDAFTVATFRGIMNIVTFIIREANHNTTVSLNEINRPLEPEERGSIEALNSLWKYYKLLKISADEY